MEIFAFLPLTCEAKVSQIWGLHKKKINNFLIENSRKLYFGHFLPILRETRIFLENLFPFIFCL